MRISPGETVGLIGRNGAGKSSTLRVLAGIVPPDRGVVRCGGRIVTLLELGTGFSRDFTGRENIYLNGALHGLSKGQIEKRIDPIIAFADLGTFMEAPVKTYSSGMFVRLGFAIAAHLDADILLIDEVLAVGDEAFQRKCVKRIADRISEGATLVLVSHAAAAIELVCERVIVLDAGQVMYDGPTPEGLLFYHRLLGTEHADSTPVPRVGASSFEIVALELQDDKGRRSGVFRAGDELRLVLRLRATTDATEALMELRVRDREGRQLFMTTITPSVDEGGGRLVFVVPHLALLGGVYEIALSVREADVPDGPTYDRVVDFSVAEEPGVAGVLDLRGKWTVPEPVGARNPTPGQREGNGTLQTDAGLTDGKDVVRTFYEQAINGRDVSACERLVSVDFTHNGERIGQSGQGEVVQSLLDAFSPLLHEILVLLAEDDLVCAHQRWSGTHVGAFVGYAPTGREISFTSTTIFEVQDGRISASWGELDASGLVEQLVGADRDHG